MKLWDVVKKWWPGKDQEESPQTLHRYQRLQEMMRQKGIDHYLIEDPTDVYYFTGLYFSACSLMAHAEGHPDLMVDSRYFDALKRGFWHPHLLEKGFWQRFWQRSQIRSISFDPDKTTYTRFQELSDQTVDFGLRLIPQKNLIGPLQRVKDSSQIEKMTYAGEIAVEALSFAKSSLKEGITEKEVVRLIRRFFIDRGADIAFEPIVAFADHTAIPHHSSTDRALEVGNMVLIDLGAKLDRYCSDMTRTFFFKAATNAELERMWKLTYDAFNLAKSLVKTGVSCAQLDRQVRDFFKQNQIESRFTHSLGHGIGLHVHESPRIRSDSDYHLETGAIITIEPGLYVPGLGGVRLEDTLVVHPEGAVSLTPSPFDLVISDAPIARKTDV